MSGLLEWAESGFIERNVALVRYKREWRLCFVETPERHISFAGVYFYGGKNLKDATADAERISSRNGWGFVGRLDKYAGGRGPTP